MMEAQIPGGPFVNLTDELEKQIPGAQALNDNTPPEPGPWYSLESTSYV